MQYTIGITTFELRFDLIQKLIRSIRAYSSAPIIVTVNGNINGSVSEEYRRAILAFFSETPNVFPVFFNELRGLAKMFNTIFVHAATENVLVLNDDLEVTESVFFTDLEKAFSELTDICKLQTSWFGSFSHFIARKSFIDEIGYFDERLLGFGEEDGDITYRYILKTGRDIPVYAVSGITHYESTIRHPVKPGVGKYSQFNRSFMFNEKYELNSGTIQGMFGVPALLKLDTVSQYPYEKFFQENKSKL